MPKEYWMKYIKDSIDQIPISRPGIPSGLKFQWPVFVQRELYAKFKSSAPSDSELDTFFSRCNYKKFEDFNVCRFYPGSIPDSLIYQMFEDQKWLNENYGSDIVCDLLSTAVNWKAYKQIKFSNWGTATNYISLRN